MGRKKDLLKIKLPRLSVIREGEERNKIAEKQADFL